jgi:hypothetical protein
MEAINSDLLDLEQEGSMLFQNTSDYLPDDNVTHPKTWIFINSAPWQAQVLCKTQIILMLHGPQ